MNKFILLLLIFFAMPACSSCIIEPGRYQNAGGGELAVYLNLSPDEAFLLEQETWQPGDYENREKSTIEGNWSCQRDHLRLETENQNYNAQLRPIGENPLGINQKTVVLHFESDSQKDNSYLSDEILYPQATVSD